MQFVEEHVISVRPSLLHPLDRKLREDNASIIVGFEQDTDSAVVEPR
jgi:hypothetical protein